MPSTRPSLVRLLKIHQLLALGTYPGLISLAELCEVHPRTIKRDLRLLREEMKAPVALSRERKGYYYTRPFTFAPEPFSHQELLALSMSLHIAETFTQTPFGPAIKGALEKLRMMYLQSPEAFAAPDCVTLLTEPSPPESIEHIIHFYELLHAIEGHCQVKLRYYAMSQNSETERILEPYQLYYHNGMWYVYGYCRMRQEDRDFAIARIRSLKTLETTFTPPDIEIIKQRLQARFANISDEPVEVRIWFDADTTRRIRERIWHPSQQIAEFSDGTCTLTMTVSGLLSILRWLLSFGSHARPLSPPQFVDMVNQEIQKMTERINTPPPLVQ